MKLRLTGRLHRRWRSLQAPVTKELHPLTPTTSPTTAQSLHAFQHGLLQPNNCHGSTTHHGIPDNHCLTTLPTLSFSLDLHWKSINYSHNNKQLHFHNWTTHDPFTASLETSGCPTTIPHCSAFHYLKQPTSTTTTQLRSTLQLATTPTTSSSNYRLDNN